MLACFILRVSNRCTCIETAHMDWLESGDDGMAFNESSVTRREFLARGGSGAVLAAATLAGLVRRAGGSAGQPSDGHRSVIVLWMSGGPSTIDLWDLKPGADTGGPFRWIGTTGDGPICEHLPLLAQRMHHFAIVRSMSTGDTEHEAARQRMRSVGLSCAGCGGGDFSGALAQALAARRNAEPLTRYVRIGDRRLRQHQGKTDSRFFQLALNRPYKTTP